MGSYSDPTANRALGNINREFSRREKKAKRFLDLLEQGKLTSEALEREKAQFTGIYRHVLNPDAGETQKATRPAPRLRGGSCYKCK